MVQVYNYMLESLPVNRNAKYPVSKRDELKKVYSEIINLSKRSPFYKIDLSQENQEYTIGVKEAALALKSKIQDMSNPEISGLESKTVSISDSTVLSAKLLKEDTNALPTDIEVTVKSLANVQVNRGKELLSTSKGLASGEYEFVAQIGDEKYSLTFIQETRIVNQEVLSKMADYLNKAVPGINATVEKGSSKDYSQLVVASDMSGRFGDKRFVFEDKWSNDGVVAYLGIDRMEQAPSFAKFSLNGIDKQTATNSFSLENTLKITLNNSSEQATSIKIVPDSVKVLSGVDSILTTYNDLVKLATDRTINYTEHYKATKLIDEMKSLESAYGEELSANGFVVSEDGTMKLEDSLAAQAVEDGSMGSLFTRENGFIARLLDKAETIAINPMEYLDKTIVTYPNNQKIEFSNPYVTSMYSGLFFNSYC